MLYSFLSTVHRFGVFGNPMFKFRIKKCCTEIPKILQCQTPYRPRTVFLSERIKCPSVKFAALLLYISSLLKFWPILSDSWPQLSLTMKLNMQNCLSACQRNFHRKDWRSDRKEEGVNFESWNGNGFKPFYELKTKLSIIERTYLIFTGEVRPRINDLTTKINSTDRCIFPSVKRRM